MPTLNKLWVFPYFFTISKSSNELSLILKILENLSNFRNKQDVIYNWGNYDISQTSQGHLWGRNYPHMSNYTSNYTYD